MNKKLYNAPEVREINYLSDGCMMDGLTGSGGDKSIGNNGGTKDQVTDADANKRDAEWGNLW